MKENFNKETKERKLKNKQLTIRVTEEELKAIEEFLQKHQINNRSLYILSQFNDTKVNQFLTQNDNSNNANIALLRYEINKIGNNINQIAYRFNQQKEPIKDSEIKSSLHNLQLMLVKIGNKIDRL